MFKINSETKQVNLTRGDIASFKIKAMNDDGTYYQFKTGDVITLAIYEKKNLENTKLKKGVIVAEPSEDVILNLTSEDTKLDELTNKPIEYWYEITLKNTNSNDEQTIIGYDENGAKIFKLYPEGE